MNTSKQRDQACICLSDFSKKDKPKGFYCKCTASVVQKKYLTEKQVLVKDFPLSESYKLDLEEVREVSREHKDLSVHLFKFAEATTRLRSLVSPPLSVTGKTYPLVSPDPPVDKGTQAAMSKTKTPSQEEIDAHSLDDSWGRMSTGLLESLGDAAALEVFQTKGFFKDYEYQGFDVLKFRENFMKLCDLGLTSKNTVWNGEKMVEIHGSGNYVRLLSFFICLFNLRGNNIDKIIDGLDNPKAKAHLLTIKNVLGIEPQVAKKGEARSTYTVTLSRIAASYPVIAVQAVMNPLFTRQVIDLSDIGVDQSKPEGRVLAHPMLGSILMLDQIKDGFVYITFLAAIRLNRVIGGNTNKKVDYVSLWNFQRAVLCSKAASEKVRKLFWDNLSMPVPDQIIADAKKIVRGLLDADLFKKVSEYTGCEKE
nr:nucleoprotein [Aedes albopictus bunya-like virus]